MAALTNHHNPRYDGKHLGYCQAVYLANILEYRFNDNPDLNRATEVDEEVLRKFIPDKEQMEILKVKFEAETERNSEILKLFR